MKKIHKKRKSVFFVSSIGLVKISSYCDEYYKFLLGVYKDENALEVDHRTWGWYPTLKEAKDAVARNVGDIHECSYPWVCIEEIEWGIFVIEPLAQYFYEWESAGDENDFDGKWVSIDGWPKKLEELYEDRHMMKLITSIG